MAGNYILHTYDGDQLMVYFNGNLIQGWDENDVCTIEQMSEGFTSVVGVDGEVTRSKTNDRRVKVTLKIMQSSAANATLSAIHKTDLNAPNGAGVGAFKFVDLNGTSQANGDKAWITKYPDAAYSRTAKVREWVIEIANGQ